MTTSVYKIIEENQDLVVISKSPGISFHKEGDQIGIPAAIREELKLEKLFTVHRLDTVTSGLLIFAKNSRAASKLAYKFREGMIEKYYLAISDCKPLKTQGLIKGDMVRARRGAWKLTRNITNPAVTRFYSCPIGDGLRLFILRPYTGKTHQLRVALKSISAAVLGDPLYHKKGAVADRTYLHSYAIRFKLNGTRYQFIDEPDTGEYFLSGKFREAVQPYRIPWDLGWVEPRAGR